MKVASRLASSDTQRLRVREGQHKVFARGSEETLRLLVGSVENLLTR